MHTPTTTVRAHRIRTLALMTLCGTMLTLLAPLTASAIDTSQLDGVPLPTLNGEFQNTDNSAHRDTLGFQSALGDTSQTTTSANNTATQPSTSPRAPITQPMLVLMPHCLEQDRTTCEQFIATDPVTLTTRAVALGDLLDIDVVLQTPNPAVVTTVRSWLQYDPTALEARSVELLPALSQPIPGEQEVDKTRGLVKIGGGAQAGSIRTQETPIARITFRVLSAQQNTTITFSNFMPDGKGETTILDGAGSALLTTQPSLLRILAQQTGGMGQSSSTTYTPPPVTNPGSMAGGSVIPPTSPAPTGTASAFDILQVQGVRVTSQGDSLYVGWLPLATQELAGYNVYYGTVSGRYIQRRGLPTSETSLVIRGLETGVQYFVAIRGFTAAGNETAFSQEASVVIGRPETSTSPLLQRDINEPQVNGNPVDTRGGGHVVGETGINDTIAFLLFIAAIAGTILAWRRQLTLTPASSDHE